MSSEMQIPLQTAEGVWGSPVREGVAVLGDAIWSLHPPPAPAAAGAGGAGSVVGSPRQKPVWEGGAEPRTCRCTELASPPPSPALSAAAGSSRCALLFNSFHEF